ncbi:hypothetical protein PM082_016944 [Marasmius tenuissimus]|nr:hypothetical protein PM082_016944 [Marasmius tenuissimus]
MGAPKGHLLSLYLGTRIGAINDPTGFRVAEKLTIDSAQFYWAVQVDIIVVPQTENEAVNIVIASSVL